MDLEEIEKTETWELYDKGVKFLQQHHVYSDTDLNYRMYDGNQWEGAIIDGIESAQYNFIETIVNYKVSTINANLWAINYSSENFENRDLLTQAEKVCKMFNKKAANVWEKDQMDFKIRCISDDSAINDEGIMYVTYDEENNNPVNEIINKTNVFYGNENSSDIQSQPYILISQRLPINQARDMAKSLGVPEEKIRYILGDNFTFEEAGDESKYEINDMCTIITKMWRNKGTIWYKKSTKYVELTEDKDTKLKLYPITHFNWKEKKGWARGEGEVRGLVPNQIELNKTLARTLLSVKNCAYPQKIAAIERISNPSAIGQIGGIIKAKGNTVEDVNKIFSYVQPTSMSTDVSKVMNDLISITRELKNAGDIATGGINPEQASGKAILAVQQASQQPLVKQLTSLKRFIEDLARIWMEMWTVYTPKGISLEEEVTDVQTGEEYTQLYKVPSSLLEALKTRVKVDITPKGAYDRYARELTLENLLKGGYFNPQRIGETRAYAKALPDDAVAPKQEILNICDDVEEAQAKIAEINARAQMLQQNYNQYVNSTPEDQANTINQIMENSTM